MLVFAAFLVGCAPFSAGDAISLPDGPIPVDHSADASAEVSEAVEALALDFMETHQLPALGLALVVGGAVCYSGGYGWADIAADRALTTRTPVLLSSASKTFIGVAAMQGAEAGRLTLDDPAADLAGFAVDNPKVDGETISLRDLLTHNSGIEDSLEYDAHYAEGDPTVSLGDFTEGYLTEGGDYWRRGNYANRMPGEAFSYSNVGAALAGYAVGQADGLEFMDLVARDIFGPLGMDDSAYLLSDLAADPAVPYEHIRKRDAVRAWPQYGYPTYPDGMIRSSAADMGRYLAAIGGGGTLGEVQILSADGVAEMLTVDKDAGSDEDGQAIAWAMRALDGEPLYGHNGGDYGSLTEVWVDPETGAGFVILMTAFPTSWEAVIDLEKALYALAGERCAAQP